MSEKDIYYTTIQTNADRIRAMSDEELAVFLADKVLHVDCGNCEIECNGRDMGEFGDVCHFSHYKWLRQPAE